MTLASRLYVGRVTHKRLRPTPHALSYRVFALVVDLDELRRLGGRLRLLSPNRWNLFSVYERDHGSGGGDLAATIRDLLTQHDIDTAGGPIEALLYPRMLGYVFNPLTVYFCYTPGRALAALVYEVSNTFGGRTSYVLPVAGGGEQPVFQSCAKTLRVSPFNGSSGRYTFHVAPPGERVAVGVLLRDEHGPVLKAHFAGTRLALSDRALLAQAVRLPLMTLKVIGAIHWEALKLWRKGVPLVRPDRAAPDPSVAPPARRAASREP